MKKQKMFPRNFPMQVSLLALTLLSACMLQPGETNQVKQQPNIILIMADDLGWGDVGFNGNAIIKTPELDKMAASGIRFTRFYAGAPVCSPTRGSVLTGRHPERYGIHYANVGHLKRQEYTLAEALKERGYATGHFGKWHVGTLTKTVKDGRRGGNGGVHYSPPWENGFDTCFSTEVGVPTWNPMKDLPYESKYWTGPGTYAESNLEGDDSRVIMDRALPFMENAVDQGQPFFSVIWFHTPHSPVVAGPEYREMYSAYNKDKQHYYGCITAMDEQVGRLRSALRRMNVAENTMVFFVSDNGPAGSGGGTKQYPGQRQQGSAGPFRGRKGSLYEGGVRVPALLEWPARVRPNQETGFPLSTSDYFPTIVSLVNSAVDDDRATAGPQPLDGINMLPVLDGVVEERIKPIFFRSKNERSMVEMEFKLYSSNNGETWELYNLLEDPGETTNMASRYPEKVSEMSARIEEWINGCERSNQEKDYGNAGSGTAAGDGMKKPNILFLFADDMRYSTIHALNNEEIITPALDELSRRSTVFLNTYILGGMNAAVCAPSRAMMMTGRELFQNPPAGSTIADSLITLPQAFRKNGYETFGTGKWHNGKASYARSFSIGSHIMFGGMTGSQYQLPLYDFDSTGIYPASSRQTKKGPHSSTVYANAAIEFLENHDKDRPFFMYVAFQAPHDPRQAPDAFQEMYDTASLRLPPNFLSVHPFDNGELDVRDEKLAGFPRQPREIKGHVRDYYAMISHLDQEIGRVIQALKASGEFDNTIIVFSADNGLAVGQHGLMGKQNLYEHSIKIPMMISGPGTNS